MTITMRETHRSRAASYGTRDQSHKKRYRLFNPDEGDDPSDADELIWSHLFANAPLVVDIPDSEVQLVRQRFDYEPLGAGRWDATVTYGNPEDPESKEPSQPPQPQEPSEPGEPGELSFDMAGSTQLITRSKQTIARYPFSNIIGDGPDRKRFVNVTKDGIKGVEVFVPTFSFQIRKTFPTTFVWWSYLAVLNLGAGKVNLETFYGFSEKEVLFKGAQGAEREDGAFELTYSFEVSRSILLADNVMVGDCGPVEKKGWDYLWVETYEEFDEDLGLYIEKPYCVHVEQLYDTWPFGLLQIGEAAPA